MSGDTGEEAVQVDALGMSDEDFNNLPLDAFEDSVEDNPEGGDLEAGEESTEEEVSEGEETDLEDSTDESETGESEKTDETDTDDDTEETDDEVDSETDESTDTTDTTDESTEENTDESDDSNIDFEVEHKKLLAPFKANGKEIQVNNVEEAISLMQMGANYNKKMAGLKPSLKLLKMLEQNSLLDEGKLSYLIDLDKKDPEAIKKLVKDSKLDSVDLDDDTGEYKPKTYTVDDNEIELDQTLEDIRDTESYSKTLDIVGNKWDEASKKILLENPAAIKTINEHVALGVYDKIATQVERERMLGKLQGLSDIEAYKAVGEAINAQGGFNTQPEGNTESTKTEVTKKTTDTQRKAKRKAASPTKAKTAKKTKESFDPLSMSDEDFEKLSPKFI